MEHYSAKFDNLLEMIMEIIRDHPYKNIRQLFELIPNHPFYNCVFNSDWNEFENHSEYKDYIHSKEIESRDLEIKIKDLQIKSLHEIIKKMEKK